MTESSKKGLRWKALRTIAEKLGKAQGVEWWPIRDEPEREAFGLYFDTRKPLDKLTLLAIAEKYQVTIEVEEGLVGICATDTAGLIYDDDWTIS